MIRFHSADNGNPAGALLVAGYSEGLGTGIGDRYLFCKRYLSPNPASLRETDLGVDTTQ